jgi:hypothetical protein
VTQKSKTIGLEGESERARESQREPERARGSQREPERARESQELQLDIM